MGTMGRYVTALQNQSLHEGKIALKNFFMIEEGNIHMHYTKLLLKLSSLIILHVLPESTNNLTI